MAVHIHESVHEPIHEPIHEPVHEPPAFMNHQSS